MNAAQQAAINRAKSALGGTSVYEDEEDEKLLDPQVAAIARAKAALGQNYGSDNDIGLGREIIYGMTRAGVGLLTFPQQYVGEELAQISDLKRDRLAREADGDVSALSRLNTGLSRNNETPDQLDRQAAGYLQNRAQRLADVNRGAPTSQRAIEGVELFTDLDEDKGFFGKIGQGLSQIASDPLKAGRGLLAVTSEQIPTIAAGGAVSLLTKSPKAGIGVMTGSSYQQERFGQLASTAQEYGYDLTDRAQALAAVQDETFIAEQKRRGYTRGAIIATIDAATLGIAARTPLSLLGVGKNTAIQGVAGGLGEAAGGYAATGEVDAGEVLVETFAEGVTAPLDVAALGLRNRKAKNAAGGSDLFSEADTAALEADAANSETTAKEVTDTPTEQIALDLNDPEGNIATQQRVEREQKALAEQEVQIAQAEQNLLDEKRRVAAQTISQEEFYEQAINDPNTPLGAAWNAQIVAERYISPKEIEGAKKKFLADATKNTKSVDDGAYVAELDRRITAQEQPELNFNQQTEAEKAQEVAQQLQDELAKPAQTASKAIEQTERIFGPDWVNSGQYDDLAAAVNSFNRKTYAAELAKAVNAPAAPVVQPPVNALTETQDTPVEAVAEPTDPKAKVQAAIESIGPTLKRAPQQKKIFDTFTKALFNNEMDKYIQVNIRKGQDYFALNYQALADDAGITGENNRTAANNSFKRIQPKLNKALGIDEGDATGLKQLLDLFVAQRKPKAKAEPDANEASSVEVAEPTEVTDTTAGDALDKAKGANVVEAAENMADVDAPIQSVAVRADADENPETQEAYDTANEQSAFEQGRRLVDTAGKGNYDNVDPEDETYSKARSNERNDIVEQRRREAEERLLPTSEPFLRPLWEARKGDNDLSFEFLNTDQKIMWMKATYAFTSDNNSENYSRAKDLIAAAAAATQPETSNETTNTAEQRPDAKVQKSVRENDGSNLQGDDGSRSGTKTGRDSPSKENEKPKEEVKPKRLMPKSFKTGEAFVADVYHGTDTDIQEFDSSKLGQNTGAASASEAFFFAGKGETASTYAEIRSEKQNETEFKQTMTVAKKFLEKKTLNAEDQQVLSNMIQRSKEMKGGKEFVESLIKAAEKTPGSVAVVARKMALQLRPVPRPNVQIQRIQMQNPLVKDFEGARFRDETYVSLIKKAKKAGHDGVVLLNTYDVAGKRKEEITEADKDNIFAVFDAKDVTNTFKVRENPNRFSKKTPEGLTPTTVDEIERIADAMYFPDDKVMMPVDQPDQNVMRLETEFRDDGPVDVPVVRTIPEKTQRFDLSAGSPYSRVKVHATAKDAFRALKGRMKLAELKGVRAFIAPGDKAPTVAHFIAENIPLGQEAGVVAHEIGVHIAMEGMLDAREVSKLAEAVNDWSNEPEGSVERNIHDLVSVRMAFARATGMDQSLTNIETIAYAVEEAVNLGVTPTKTSMKKVQRWLDSTLSFFMDLVGRFHNKYDFNVRSKAVISPQELVSLAYGAAKGQVGNFAIVENGATTSNPKELMSYYAGEDRPGTASVEEDARLDRPKQGKQPAPKFLKGEETYYWGKDSTIGKETNIRTLARFDENGSMEMEVRNGKGETLIELQFNTIFDSERGEFRPDVFSLIVSGPESYIDLESETSETASVEGDPWSRLEGVRSRDVVRILVEARRRITRHNLGAIPSVMWQRVTGSSANNALDMVSEDDPNKGGRRGRVTYQKLFQRFSVAPKGPRASIRRAKGREFVRGYLGGDAGVQFYDGLAGVVSAPAEYLKFLYDVVYDAPKAVFAEAKALYTELKAQEAVKNELAKETETIAIRAKRLKPQRYAMLNEFLGASTFYQKWGYDPKDYDAKLFEKKATVVDPTLKRAFNKLTKEEQGIVVDVFAQGEKRLQRKREFAKALGLSDNFFGSSSLNGPYSPLKRFGNHVVVLKSKKLRAAEAALVKTPNSENRKALNKLKGQAEHYVVQYFDTRGAANRFAEANEGKYDRPEAFKRGNDFDSDRAPSTELLDSLLGKLKANSDIDSENREAFRAMVLQHYFESMDARDARTSGAKRLNRAGYDKDMMRSFVYQSTAEARLISTMENGAAVNEALATLKKKADTNRGELLDTYNLMSEHYRSGMTREDGMVNAIQDRIASFNTVSMLTTSFSYYVQNGTQILIAVDKLVGDFGGYKQAWSEIFKAYKIARKTIEGGGIARQLATVGTFGLVPVANNVQINNTDGAMPKEYQDLVRELELHQLADVGVQEDLAQFNKFDTGFGTLNKASDKAAGVVHRLYQATRYVEAHLRLVTAIAAYNMAKQNPTKLKQFNVDSPKEYAVSAVQRTQGAFNGLDAPLAIKKLPKLMTQYRKYQIMMAWNYSRAFKQVFAGETPEMKLIGLRTLGVTLGQVALTTGTKGIPLLTSVAGLAMMFLADEEDEIAEKAKASGGGALDFQKRYNSYVEQVIRENVENKNLANLLTRGVPAYLGLDLSGKIGHQTIFSFSPYSDLEFTRDGVSSYLFDVAAGPTSSTLRNTAAGIEAWKNGDTIKGLGLMIPKGPRAYLDSVRWAKDGIQLSNQDTVVDPRNISLSTLLVSALGLTPTEIGNLKFTRSQQFVMKKYFDERTTKINREYARANDKRDRAAKKELREEWRELQKAKDKVRPYFNNSRNVLRRQPVTDLIRSPRRQSKRERRAIDSLGTKYQTF
jgi:hypothetical protein